MKYNISPHSIAIHNSLSTVTCIFHPFPPSPLYSSHAKPAYSSCLTLCAVPHAVATLRSSASFFCLSVTTILTRLSNQILHISSLTHWHSSLPAGSSSNLEPKPLPAPTQRWGFFSALLELLKSKSCVIYILIS